MRLLAVDPGIRGCGVALFLDGTLKRADFVTNRCKSGNTAHECAQMAFAVVSWLGALDYPDELAVEWPRVYVSRMLDGTNKGDPNDLLALCGVVSAVAALVCAVETESYAPSDWKGTMKKEVCHPRIVKRLSEDERAIVDRVVSQIGAKAHNTLDAVGIGLHYLNRFERKRAIV